MSRVVLEIALDDPDPAMESDLWDWTDWTAYVERDENGVATFRGFRDGSDVASPTEIRFRGKNGDLRWSLDHPNNPYLGRIRKRTPIRVSRDYGTAVVRAVAYIEEISLVSADAGAYQAADVVAYGATYQAESVEVQSVLYGQISNDPHLISYIPGEDASGATTLRNAVAGQPPAQITGVDAGADSDIIGSKPGWKLSGTAASAVVQVPPYSRPLPEQWAFALVVKVPSEPAGAVALFYVRTTGTVQTWGVQITPGSPATIRLVALSAASGADLIAATTPFTDQDGVEPWGRTVGIIAAARQNGTGVDWRIRIYCTHTVSNPGSGTSGTLAATTLGPVTLMSTWPTADIDGWTMVHWALFDDVSPTDFIYFNGYQGEPLSSLFFTTAINSNVPIHVSGADTTSTAAPMLPGRVTDLLRTLATSESGLMFERADGSVQLLLREELYNQAVDLTINRANKQILALDAISDGFQSANRVSASNSTGDSAVADALSPYDPATVGWARDAPISTALETAEQVLSAAQHEVAVRSTPDYRYRIVLELDGPASGLRAGFLASVDIGSRIQVTGNSNDPSTLGTIDQQVMGIEEWHTEQGYRVTLNTRSARPWQAFEVESSTGNLGRADTRGARLLAAIDDNDTAALVGSYDTPDGIGAKFSTTAVPYDLALRAVDRVTCTAVTNRTCVFVAAGTAAHADNAAVTPAHPAGISLGDLELLIASVRDSTGEAWLSGIEDRRALIVGDQLGWKVLASFGGTNDPFLLAGRIYDGTAAPTLTPQFSDPTDTVSAQLCAFRYAQPDVHRRGLASSTAAATNIAYAGVGSIARANTLVILAVQRDDDWTTTTAPAGFTKISDPSSTTGADQGMAWYYQIQTTPTLVGDGSVVVTGGSGASKSIMVSLVTDVQTLTLTRAVEGGVTSHPALADVRLWRAGSLIR